MVLGIFVSGKNVKDIEELFEFLAINVPANSTRSTPLLFGNNSL